MFGHITTPKDVINCILLLLFYSVPWVTTYNVSPITTYNVGNRFYTKSSDNLQKIWVHNF